MAPILLGQANTDTANRINAANTLYGAGNTTSGLITGNNTTANANKVAGIDVANSALSAKNYGATSTIAADELGKSIPATDLGMLAQIGIPIAGLNTTTNGNTTTDQSVSPSMLQDIMGIGSLFAGGANGGSSAFSGLGSAAAGAGSGILALLGKLGGL
jgi:hypothetical protein